MSNGTSDKEIANLRHRIRHSAAHVMADAVQELFPDVCLAIGPPTEDGFYYDFDVSQAFVPEDLERIEKIMNERIANDLKFEYHEMNRERAKEIFANQPFKIEIIDDLPDTEVVTSYQHGNFTDLCQGPHVESTGKIVAFKLLSIAGAYWRGDENKPMLQRIYGTAFETKEALDENLELRKEALKRDHRKIGKELDLFSIYDDIGPGLVVWHPNGGILRTIIEDLWRKEHYQRGYSLVYSPHIGRSQLWKTSGHLDFYSENMYSKIEVDSQEYYLRPMNCPFHIMVYKSTLRSYKELPIRIGELGTVYRYERTGVLHGLMRVRGFTQDDAHIFCRPDQVQSEIVDVLDLALDIFQTFGFTDYEIFLSTRPEKYVGAVDSWEAAEAALKEALAIKNLDYEVEEGGGTFYGPKIDLKIRDAIGRAWQCTTVQFDFNLPERFELSYRGEDGKQHRPYMVHRALLGSLERFLGVLIEHYAGAFPVWLSPVQCAIVPIASRHNDFAESVGSRLKERGIRVDIDDRNERMQAKIRAMQLKKVPFMLIVGDKELESDTASVRTRDNANLGAMPIGEVIDRITKAISEHD